MYFARLRSIAHTRKCACEFAALNDVICIDGRENVQDIITDPKCNKYPVDRKMPNGIYHSFYIEWK